MKPSKDEQEEIHDEAYEAMNIIYLIKGYNWTYKQAKEFIEETPDVIVQGMIVHNKQEALYHEEQSKKSKRKK